MERVLVASDGSDFANGAARQAVSLLDGDVEYTVVAVVPSSTFVAGPEGGIAASVTADAAVVAAAEDDARAEAAVTAALLGGVPECGSSTVVLAPSSARSPATRSSTSLSSALTAPG